MAATISGRDRILGSAIQITLVSSDGKINMSPIVEVDSFDAKPIITSTKHWPSGVAKERTQFTGIGMKVTMKIGRRAQGIYPILLQLRAAVKAHKQVPTLRLTRHGETEYAGNLRENYIDGTVVGGGMAHGKGNEVAEDTLEIDFDDFDD